MCYNLAINMHLSSLVVFKCLYSEKHKRIICILMSLRLLSQKGENKKIKARESIKTQKEA